MSRIGPREPVQVALTGRRSVADVLWLANTRHGPAGHWHARPASDAPEHDHLDGGDWAAYLRDHRVEVPVSRPGPVHLAALRAIVDLVRALPEDARWTEPVLALRAEARYEVSDGWVRSTRPGWTGWIDDLLLPLATLVEQAEAGRVRLCGGPGCRLVFVDASRSGNRRWCDERGCGNRVRVRRARAGAVSSTA